MLISPYVARNDSGGTRFSTSAFLGGAGQAGIPLLWSPPSWQGWNNVGVNYAVWYGLSAGVSFFREFYPSVVAHYKRKQASHAPAKTPTP